MAAPQWSAEDIDRLRQLAAAGSTRRQCAQALGRNVDGIATRQGIKFLGNTEFRRAARSPERPQDDDPPAFRPLPGSRPKPLLELRSCDCRWPTGNLFCAIDTGSPKLSYCSSHRQISVARAVSPEYAMAAE